MLHRVLMLWLLALAGCLALAQGDTRGLPLHAIRDSSRKEVMLYKGSYALLVGVSHYTRGWPDLDSVPAEMERVEQALKAQGFQVVKHLDPDSAALKRAFEEFIDQYGYEPGNRLLFWFSGHGHTLERGYGEEMGYIVPADAPDPRQDRDGFLGKAPSTTSTAGSSSEPSGWCVPRPRSDS
jgi:hypothetical protein